MKPIKEYSDIDLKALADLVTQKIKVRGSEAKKYIMPNDDEKEIMEKIVYGALLACRFNSQNVDCVQGILDYAEYMFNLNFENYEAYSSIYIPLEILLDRDILAFTHTDEIYVDEEKLRRYINYEN